jgi:hypothetical protein
LNGVLFEGQPIPDEAAREHIRNCAPCRATADELLEERAHRVK